MMDTERLNWHFIPKDRPGLSIKEMTSAQRLLAHALLSSGLSRQGYMKATTIMSLEQVLQDLEGPGRRFPRDPELYHISIFGTPGPKTTWGLRFEGHHLSMNFTLIGGEMVIGTPSFMGTNPAEIKEGPRKGLRVLGPEEDLGRALVKSLSKAQLKSAVIATEAPADVITGAALTVAPLKKEGLQVTRMNVDQVQILRKLIREYVFRNRPEVAQLDLEKIENAGIETILFAWAGGMEKGDGHYYRVQGPTFLLEYDSTQNGANHVHAVWRDFKNDFGLDLLRQHYEKLPHGK